MGLNDGAIAAQAKLKPITEIAAQLGIEQKLLEQYGPYKAKVHLDILDQLKGRPQGKYIVVTAITPTPLGEGKTVNSIGLTLGLNRIGKKAVVALRQPSLGPVFGIKGGAAGGGYSQVLPLDDINLHLTGDIHAVSAAHNLLAAMIDNHLFHKNPLGIDPATITWRRAVDINDRALRNIRIGLGGEGVERDAGFDIAVASEIMAVLALASGIKDLKQRLGRMIVARTGEGKPVTPGDLKAAGALAALCKDAIKPNLLQTIENTPAFIHTGPFGNIAHGNSSIVADMIATRLSEYVVTESGFGADLGFEKFVDIKCRTSGLVPSAAMVVCTVRAMKVHSGKFKVTPGKPLPEKLQKEDVESVLAGSENLAKMIEIVNATGIPAVVAINRFDTDTDREIEALLGMARKHGAAGAEVIEAYGRGGEGATGVARAVVKASELNSKFQFLYDATRPIKEKIETLCKKVYGADGIQLSEQAEQEIATYTRWGLDKLPICMAKTHLSVSHDPNVKGRPRGFTVPIREVRASAGAGFLYPIVGEIRLMPGLPSKPAAERIDLDDSGRVIWNKEQ